MKEISVVIADDHTLVREALSYVLKKDERIKVVVECSNGKEVVAVVKDKKPNILLLDINMPVMDGFGVIEGLKNYLKDTRVICISMHTRLDYVRRMIRLGAKGYVTKNSSKEEIVKAIIEVHQGRNFICEDMKNSLSKKLIMEDPVDFPSLTDREADVVSLVKDGFTSAEIAKKLEITVETVEVHRHHILRKYKVNNTPSLINCLNKNGDL